jgi:hypothetical protein
MQVGSKLVWQLFAAFLLTSVCCGQWAVGEQPPLLRYGFQTGHKYHFDVSFERMAPNGKAGESATATYDVVSADAAQFAFRQPFWPFAALIPARNPAAKKSYGAGEYFMPVFVGSTIANSPFPLPDIEAITFTKRGTLTSHNRGAQLQFLLGFVDSVGIEPLPEQPAAAWVEKNARSVIIDDAGGTAPANEEVNYSIVEHRADRVYIAKKYLLKTAPDSKGNSRVTLTGCGALEFDTQLGLFRAADMIYSLVVARENDTVTVPVSMSMRYRTEAEMAARMEKSRQRTADAEKDLAERQKKMQDMRKEMEARIARMRAENEARQRGPGGPQPGMPGLPGIQGAPGEKPKPLTADARAKALQDLLAASTNLDAAKQAATLLAHSPRDDKADEVSEALVKAMKASDEWGSGVFLEALDVWGTDNCEQALITASKSGLFFIKGKAVELIGKKFKDETAIRAMVALFRADRGAAATAFRGIGPVAEKAVIPLAITEDFWARNDALGVLRDIGGERSLRALKRELKKFTGRNNPLEINPFNDAIAAIEKRLSDQDGGESDKPKMRLWQDSTGSFDVEATLVAVKDGKATLKKKQGKEITVPLDKLAEEDQDYVKKYQEQLSKPKPANPFE